MVFTFFLLSFSFLRLYSSLNLRKLRTKIKSKTIRTVHYRSLRDLTPSFASAPHRTTDTTDRTGSSEKKIEETRERQRKREKGKRSKVPMDGERTKKRYPIDEYFSCAVRSFFSPRENPLQPIVFVDLDFYTADYERRR